jgi:hypothetical protein
VQMLNLIGLLTIVALLAVVAYQSGLYRAERRERRFLEQLLSDKRRMEAGR